MSTLPLLSRRSILAGALIGATGACMGTRGPLAAPAMPQRRSFTLTSPEGRDIVVSEWQRAGTARGTIVFSHGALSAPWHYDRILQPVLDAGYRVLAPLHVDSTEHPRTADFKGLASWRCRIEDMRALVDHIGATPFVAMGHSYGGLVATVLGGAAGVRPEGLQGPLVPRLATSVVAFSPPAPIPVMMTREGYGALAVPALIQTGTLDVPPGTAADKADIWKGHLAPFEAAKPGGHRYALVLEGVNHYFGGAICDASQPGPMQLDALERANAVAGLFLNAFASGNAVRPALVRLDARLTDALPVRLLTR
ncbi:alpha/beta fold hydrolase [Novosphingobium gossypii]|uniref:alpha/beta fold hydrolase n=1 Tax=Novosphingobium gossypii TaxID=1604774 RepID=UPI003D1EAF29